MDFALSPKVESLRGRLEEFMDDRVYPAEPVYRRQQTDVAATRSHPPVVDELTAEARRRHLWNLFMADSRWGPGLTALEYAPLAEVMGRSPIAAEAVNCSAPDTGNMEILAEFGSPDQQQRWLVPLLDARIRSAFAMTEPGVASSDARNISSRIERDGDGYVVNGHKWWISGTADDRCAFAIFLGVTDPEADPHERHSLLIVPLDSPGVSIVRNLPIFGYLHPMGHCELLFEDVRVPRENLLGEEGQGFGIAQARLGPGRIHHCMRAVGMAERALELLCARACAREAFGGTLAQQGVIQDWIAEARCMIEGARLLVLKAAWLMDTAGKEAARVEISAIKVIAPRVAVWVLDRAIQVHGAAGLSEDLPLADMYAWARALQIVDGPDEVHKMVIARQELRKHAEERRP